MMSRNQSTYLLAFGVMIIAVVLHLLFIHPIGQASYHGETVDVYSISALAFSLGFKLLFLVGMFILLRALSNSYPKFLSNDKLLYKVLFIFLFVLLFLMVMEFALKGIFTDEVISQRVEMYENPNGEI